MRTLSGTNFVGGRLGFGLLPLRVGVGVAFLFHGWPLIHHPFTWRGAQSSTPGIFQALAAVSEFCGGAAWILGLLTPLAAFGIFCTMTVALSTHLMRGDPFVGRGASYELALVFWCVALLLLLAGPGKWSLDAVVFGRRRPGGKS